MNIPEMTDDELTLLLADKIGFGDSDLQTVNRGDLVSIIRAVEAARDAQYAAMAGQEPVMTYLGRHTIDCGEYGSHDMQMHKMIPAGTKLYTHPAPSNPAAQEPVTRYAQAAHWYINASDNELREQCDTREAAVRRVHAIEAELLADGFEFVSAAQERAEPVAPAAWDDAARYRKLQKWMSSNVPDGWREVENMGSLCAWESWDAMDAYLDGLSECRVGLMAGPQAISATPHAPAQPAQWIDDPHDIEQGQMLNPEWLKLNGWPPKQLAEAMGAQPSPNPSKPEQAEAPSDEHPAAKRMRLEFEAKYGNKSALMQAANRWFNVRTAYNDAWNRDREQPTTEADVEEAARLMLATLPPASAAGDSGAGERLPAIHSTTVQYTKGGPCQEINLQAMVDAAYAAGRIAALATKPQAEQEAAKGVPADILKYAKSMQKDGYRGPFSWASAIIDWVADQDQPKENPDAN